MSDLSKLYVRNLVEELSMVLNCTNRAIAALIGVNESSISSNLDKQLEEVVTHKTGRRIAALFLVVEYFVKIGAKSETIFEALNTPVYEDLKGNLDSVRSAISSDKYTSSINVLIQMGKLAHQKFVENQVSKDHLSNQVKDLMTA